MTTIAQRMRAASALVFEFAPDCLNEGQMREFAEQLSADADALEAVEREMRSSIPMHYSDVGALADRIRGEIVNG